MVVNATQDDGTIILSGGSQDNSTESKQTRASEDLSLESILHDGQTDGLEWARKLEDSKLTAPQDSRLAALGSIMYTRQITMNDQPASLGREATTGILDGATGSKEARSRRLGLNAEARPASSAMLPAVIDGNQADSGENPPGIPQWHPVRPETYMEQLKDLLLEMDRLVTQFERCNNSPASKNGSWPR